MVDPRAILRALIPGAVIVTTGLASALASVFLDHGRWDFDEMVDRWAVHWAGGVAVLTTALLLRARRQGDPRDVAPHLGSVAGLLFAPIMVIAFAHERAVLGLPLWLPIAAGAIAVAVGMVARANALRMAFGLAFAMPAAAVLVAVAHARQPLTEAPWVLRVDVPKKPQTITGGEVSLVFGASRGVSLCAGTRCSPSATGPWPEDLFRRFTSNDTVRALPGAYVVTMESPGQHGTWIEHRAFATTDLTPISLWRARAGIPRFPFGWRLAATGGATTVLLALAACVGLARRRWHLSTVAATHLGGGVISLSERVATGPPDLPVGPVAVVPLPATSSAYRGRTVLSRVVTGTPDELCTAWLGVLASDLSACAIVFLVAAAPAIAASLLGYSLP